MDNIYLILGLGALIVILIVALLSKEFRARLTKNGFWIRAKKDKQKVKDDMRLEKIVNSRVEINQEDNTNYSIEDIEKSKIRINQSDKNQKN